MNGYVDLGTNNPFGPIQTITNSSGTAYTMPSGTKKVKVQFRPTSTYYWSKSNGAASIKVQMVDRNATGTTEELFTFTVTAGEVVQSGGIPSSPVEKDLSKFAGKSVGIKFSIVANTTSSYPQLQGKKMPIRMDSYTAVVAGNKILATDRSQTGTSTTAGAVMTDSHFSSGTLIQASTFNTKVLGL